jgi:hypothetical protein
MEFGIGGLHQKLSGEFNFGLYRSNVTFPSREAQIKLNNFLKNGYKDLIEIYNFFLVNFNGSNEIWKIGKNLFEKYVYFTEYTIPLLPVVKFVTYTDRPVLPW